MTLKRTCSYFSGCKNCPGDLWWSRIWIKIKITQTLNCSLKMWVLLCEEFHEGCLNNCIIQQPLLKVNWCSWKEHPLVNWVYRIYNSKWVVRMTMLWWPCWAGQHGHGLPRLRPALRAVRGSTPQLVLSSYTISSKAAKSMWQS